MKKSNSLKFLFLCVMFLLIIANLIVLLFIPKLIVIICFFVLILILFVGMHLIQSLTTYYQCPKCKHEFKINIFKDVICFYKSGLGKKIKCPKCHEKTYMKEVNK